MKTTEPLSDIEQAPNHTPLLDHPEPLPPPAAVSKRLCIRVLSSIIVVSLIFVFAFVLILINQRNSINNPSNSTLPKKSPLQYSQSDRLVWQRTAFHFQPAKNFIYDPDGPLFHMGWYHLFYQFNPYAPVWGNMSWGHSVSKDMINWFELPVALTPTEWYDIEGVLSGSTTVLPNGEIFALYTGNANDFSQLQCKAVPVNVSDPLLIKWVKYGGNPILYTPRGIGLVDYRDPSTVWMGPDGKYRMIMGTKRNTTGLVLVYYTTDFTNYVLKDEPLHSVPNTDMWECVDFYPVSLTNDSALDMAAYGSGIKHVIKESWEGHGKDWYSIGTYDATTDKWTPDNPELDVGIGYRCDYGRYFASKSLYDPLKKRRVTWGYVAESDTHDQDVSRGWATIFNVARTVVLDRKTGTHLLHWPVEEIESLRFNGKVFEEIELKPGSVVPLDIGSAMQLDIVATFEVDQNALKATSETNEEYGCTTSSGAAERGSFGPFGVAVLADGTLSELTPVYFYIAKNTKGGVTTHFCTDKLRSSFDYDDERVVYGSSVPVFDDEELAMRILVDHSVVEGFAQGGRTAMNSRDALAKSIYSSLFDWLVEQINKSLSAGKRRTGRSISILDIYGFESFDVNSLEQFCINYANERLQQHFNRHLFNLEQEEYIQDGIDWAKVEFEDNQTVFFYFDKCFKSIKDHAFVNFHYPVIITFEDHLTSNLQAKVAEVICSVCDTEQPVARLCTNCGVNMGKYYCELML